MESLLDMNQFDVIDMPGMNTIAFLVEKNENEKSAGYNVFVLHETPDPVVLAFHPEDWLR